MTLEARLNRLSVGAYANYPLRIKNTFFYFRWKGTEPGSYQVSEDGHSWTLLFVHCCVGGWAATVSKAIRDSRCFRAQPLYCGAVEARDQRSRDQSLAARLCRPSSLWRSKPPMPFSFPAASAYSLRSGGKPSGLGRDSQASLFKALNKHQCRFRCMAPSAPREARASRAGALHLSW